MCQCGKKGEGICYLSLININGILIEVINRRCEKWGLDYDPKRKMRGLSIQIVQGLPFLLESGRREQGGNPAAFFAAAL